MRGAMLRPVAARSPVSTLIYISGSLAASFGPEYSAESGLTLAK